VRDWVAVNGFVRASVDAEVGLTVAIQIELVQGDAAFDRLLEDRRGYASSVPRYFSGESGAH